MSRCIGHCCRLFYAPTTPEKITRCQEAAVKREQGEPFPVDLTLPRDHETILDMLIPVRPVVEGETPPGQKTYKIDRWGSKEGWLFRCKHFDEESHDCRIYDRRPKMCRDYPYGEPCDFEGCTYTPEKDDEEETGRLAQETGPKTNREGRDPPNETGSGPQGCRV